VACIVFVSDSLVIEHWRKSAGAQIVKLRIWCVIWPRVSFATQHRLAVG